MRESKQFKIVSKKHNNVLHRSWEENTLLYHKQDIVIGGNNQTIVTEANGKKWRTVDPALFFFDKTKWFNIIIVFESERYFYYCNICSPFMWKENELHYIDYDIDVIVQSDYSFKIVDADEYEQNRRLMNYPSNIDSNVKQSTDELVTMINKRERPFNRTFINKWATFYFDQLKRRNKVITFSYLQ